MSRAALLVLAALSLPLPAQTILQGTLKEITVMRFTGACNGQGPYEKMAPAASVPLSLTATCSGATIKMDATLTPALTTSKAQLFKDGNNRLVFEEGIRFAANTRATFTFNNSLGSRIAYEFYPDQTTTGAARGCRDITEKNLAAASGTWSDSLALDCLEAKELYVNADYNLTNVYLTRWFTIWGNLQVSKATTHAAYFEIGLTYTFTPVAGDTAAISSSNPAAGLRQDPGGIMGGIATVNYALNSRDSAVLQLLAYDQDNRLLRSSPERSVSRGSASAQLNIPSFNIPRAATSLRWVAELRAPASASALARSQPIQFPVDVDLLLDHVETIQVVQTADNAVPLTANRPTWIRFHARARQANSLLESIAYEVRAFRDGAELPTSPLLLAEEGTFTSTEIDRQSDSALYQLMPDDWTAAGSLELRVQINPAGELHLTEANSAGNTKTQTVTFHPRPRLDLLYRSVCLQPGEDAEPACPSGSRDGSELGHLAFVFPIQGGLVSYDPLPAPPKLWKKPLQSAADWDLLLQDLQFDFELSPNYSGTSTQLIGWLPAGARGILEDGSALMGLSYPVADGGSGRVLLATENAADDDPAREAFILAHELGHHFGLNHPFPQPACSVEEPAHLTGEINIIGTEFYNASHFHMMSPCHLQGGVSVSQYQTLWDGGFRPAGAPAAVAGIAPSSRAASSGACVLVQGTLAREGASGALLNVVPLECPSAPVPNAASDFSLRFFDASGATLADWPFPLSFLLPSSSVPLDQRNFTLRAPLPPNTARLALLRAGQELDARAASANPPQIAWSLPAAGETWTTSPLQLQWSASDPDSDPLQFAVLYSPDAGASWISIASKLTEPGFTLDPSLLTGGERVFFRVIASDGFHAASADLGPITIPQTPTAAVETSALDFCNVLRGRALALRLMVRNTGNGPLTLQPAPPAAPFSLRHSAPLSVPAGAARAMEVLFTPSTSGAFSSTLTLATNDPNQPEIKITLTGAGVTVNTPELEILTTPLEFPATPAGQTATVMLKLRNRGPAPLVLLSLTSASPLFTPAPVDPAKPLPAAASLEIPITFKPAAAGAVSSTLTLQTDDRKRPSVTIPVRAPAQ